MEVLIWNTLSVSPQVSYLLCSSASLSSFLTAMTKFKLAVSINVMSNANIVKWHICSHFNITEIDGGFYTTSQQKEAKEDLTAMYNDLVEKGLLTKENKREIRRLVSEHYWNN